MDRPLLEELKRALLDLDMDGAVSAARAAIEEGTAAHECVDATAEALRSAGKRFQEGEWFVTELVYSGEISKAVFDLLAPHIAAGAGRSLGVVVAGTVAGDVHDLGKSIFVNYARGAGFEVVDLGVDVPRERFVAAVAEHRPLALGLSCLLTVTAAEVPAVVAALRERGLRDAVKVIVGGAAMTEAFAASSGADSFAPDAVSGTDIIRAWGA